MKIKEKLLENKVHISFEVFPPKTDAKFDSVMHAVDEIAQVIRRITDKMQETVEY